ncbi:MAG: hypothetical protein PW845_29200 [Pseudomonas sp.]|nr:hypothetical protein [Pseudomonas sp.]
MSDEVQHHLQQDASVTVRLALTENRDLLPQVQALLARDQDVKVRKALIDKSGRRGAWLSLPS